MAHYKVIMIGTRDNLQKIYDSVGYSSTETSAELAFGYDYLDDNVDFYSFRKSRAFNSVELKWTKKDAEYKHLLDEIKDPIRCPDIIDIRCAPDFINIQFDRINKKNKTKEEILEWFDNQPSDMEFFVCDGHL